jgi:hypothetical protein
VSLIAGSSPEFRLESQGSLADASGMIWKEAPIASA